MTINYSAGLAQISPKNFILSLDFEVENPYPLYRDGESVSFLEISFWLSALQLRILCKEEYPFCFSFPKIGAHATSTYDVRKVSLD